MDTKEWDDLDKKYLTVMGRWFWLTVFMVVLVFFFFSPAFAGNLISRDGKDFVRLTDKPCTVESVLKMLKDADREKLIPDFRYGEASLGGDYFRACWRSSVTPEGFYIIFFDDGDHAIIPKDEFQPDGV